MLAVGVSHLTEECSRFAQLSYCGGKSGSVK